MYSVRVFTESQVRKGLSIEEQEERLIEYCKFKRYEVYKVYKDARIGAKRNIRSAYQEMMQDMRDDKINVIVTFKLDRLTRCVCDIEKINDCFSKIANYDKHDLAVGIIIERIIGLIKECPFLI